MKAFAGRGLIFLILAGLTFVTGCKQVVGGLPPCPTCAPGITALPLGALNRLYNFRLRVNDQLGNDWVVTSGNPPAGITLDRNGTVSGTPTQIGTFNFVINVSNGGRINTAAITMVIADSLTLGSGTLASGFLNAAYAQSLIATGGIPGYTWAITTPATDPAGLDITNAGPGNATYGGTPTQAGLFTFTVKITDTGNVAVLPVSITGPVTLAIFGEPAAFVVNDGAPGSVQVVDITDPLFATLGTISVGNSPREITFSPDATRAFVTNMGSDSLSIINTVTRTLASTVALGAGAQPLGVVAPNNSPFVLTANQGSNDISIVNYLQATPGVVGTVSIPFPNSGPTGLAATSDGQLVFASLINVGKVIVINIDPGLPAFHSIIAVLDIKTEVSALPFPAGPSGLGFSPASSKLFVSYISEADPVPQGVLAVVDVDPATLTFTIGTNIAVGPNPKAIGVGPNCNFVHVANTGAAAFSIVQFDLEMQVRQGSLGAGNPNGIGFSPDGQRAFVTYSGGLVGVFDAAQGNLLDTFAAASPQGIAVVPDPRFRAFPLLPDLMPGAGWQVDYSYRLCAAGGTAPYTFQENATLSLDGLPPGLSMDAKGLVTGKATSASLPDFPNLFTFTVDVTESSLAPQSLTGDARIQVCCIGFPAMAYVANFGEDSVSAINTNLAHAVDATITAGIGVNPLGVAMSPDSLTTYVSNFGSGNVSIIDTNVNNGSNPNFNTVTGVANVGLGPSGMATSPNGRLLYVANENDNTVSIVDTTTAAAVSTVNVGLSPQNVVVISTAAGHRAYVTNIFSNNLTVLDVTTDAAGAFTGVTPSGIANVGQGPVGIAVTPDESRLYITNQFDDTVRVVNTIDNSLGAIIPVGNFPTGIVIPDSGRAYVANQLEGTVSVIDIFNNQEIDVDPASVGIIDRIVVDSSPDFLAASSSGFFVYVTNFGAGTVSIIQNGGAPDVDNTVLGSVSVGMSPEGIKRQFGR